MTERRCAGPQYVFDSALARQTVCWIAALSNDWMQRVRNPCVGVDAELSPGGCLTLCVAEYVHNVFKRRASLLRGCDEFVTRSRDPVPMGVVNLGID